MREELSGLTGTEWQYVDLGLADHGMLPPVTTKYRRWCKEYEGIGKFYQDEMFGLFYFERDEDRAMFLLRWA